MRNLLIGTTAALAFGATAASAASITYTDGLPLVFSVTEISGTLSIPQFDNMGGTLILDSVSWVVTGAVQGDITLTNDAAGAALVNAATTSDIALFNAEPFNVGTAPQISLSAGTGVLTINPGETVGPIAVSDTDTFARTKTTGLAGFIGAGFVTMDYASLSGVSINGGGGNVSAEQTTFGAVGIEVTYNYSERPEEVIPVPAALPLLATALGALGLYRSRRKA
jgi:hypothetical protein